MRVVSDASNLGAGKHNGEVAAVTFGAQKERMVWDSAGSQWLGRTRTAISYCDQVRMGHGLTNINQWYYLSQPGSPNWGAWGWRPTAVTDAPAAWAAGLRLSERLTSSFWTWNSPAPQDADLALVWYNVESIDPSISVVESGPSRNLGVFLPALRGLRRWHSTGWQQNALATPTFPLLSPHLYLRRTTTDCDPRIEHVLAEWRWRYAV